MNEAEFHDIEVAHELCMQRLQELHTLLRMAGAWKLADALNDELTALHAGDVSRSELAAIDYRLGCGEWIDESGCMHYVDDV